MIRFLFVTFDGGGNQPPAFVIATELRRRGQRVTFAGYETQRRRIEELGFDFLPLPRSGSTDFQSACSSERMPMLQASVMANPDHVADVAEVVEVVGPDLVVVDGIMYAALSAAEHLGVPVAALAHTSPAAHETAAAIAARRPVFEEISALRQRLGLSPVATPTELLSRFPVIVATLRSMDPVVRGPGWNYVGPLALTGPTTDPIPLPWPRGDAEPVLLASLSTLTIYGDQTERLQTILDGLARIPVKVIVTTGPAISPGALRLPDNAVLFRFVPHAAVMPAVSACVTHAGHGTVMCALAHGVPLVCSPNAAADQPYIAARIAELGAGVVVASDAGPDAIRAATEAVLATPSFLAAARGLAGEAAAAPGAPGAAAILETIARRTAGRPDAAPDRPAAAASPVQGLTREA